MSDETPAYKRGRAARERTGEYADPNADIRCPYVTDTRAAVNWQRGFDGLPPRASKRKKRK